MGMSKEKHSFWDRFLNGDYDKSIVCSACKEKNNPSFSKCYKCGKIFEENIDHTIEYQDALNYRTRYISTSIVSVIIAALIILFYWIRALIEKGS